MRRWWLAILLVGLALWMWGCGNPTPTAATGYMVDVSALFVKVGNVVTFTAMGVDETPTWVVRVGVNSAIPNYVRVATTGTVLRVTALKATPAGKPLVASALLNGKFVDSIPISITP